MISEDLHTRFGVRIVRGFESKFRDTDESKEGTKKTDQMSQGKTSIGDKELDLMKLTEMCLVHRFVTEHTIDGEILFRFELGGITFALLSEFVKHACGHGSCVCTCVGV